MVLFIFIHPIQSEDFKMIGKLVVTSIVQGGPGLPVFSPVAYNYICTTEKYSEKHMQGIADPFVKNLLEMVRWN